MLNFKTLLKQELLRNIYSLKFFTMSIFAVLVAVLFVSVQLMDFKDRKTTYDEEMIKAEQDKKSIKVFSQLKVPIIIEPNPLSIFARGSDDAIGNKIVISLKDIPEFIKASQKKNYFLDIFRSFDLITLVQIIFSIITLFIVADSISGEREEGTLQLIFSSSVKKFEYFAVKFTASLLTISIALFIIFIITVIMMLLQPYISLNISHGFGIFMIFLLCVGFISVYILIGLIVSSLSSTASQSVLFALLTWIVIVFLYPNTVNYIVNSTVSIPSSESIRQHIEQIKDEIRNDVLDAGYSGSLNITLDGSMGGFLGLPSNITLTEKRNFEIFENNVIKGIPVILDGLERLYIIKRDYKRKLIQQKETTGTFLNIIPGYLLEQSSSKIAGTHYNFRHNKFISHAKIFWNNIVDYVKSKDGFGLKLFTQIDRRDMRESYLDYTEELRKKWNWDTYPVLSLPDLPVFTPPKRNIIPSESIKDLILLLLLNVILFITGSYLFSRADIRQKL